MDAALLREFGSIESGTAVDFYAAFVGLPFDCVISTDYFCAFTAIYTPCAALVRRLPPPGIQTPIAKQIFVRAMR